MSPLVKSLTIIALALIVLLSVSAFAQDNPQTLVARAEKPAGKIPAAPAQHAAAKTSQNWMTHRFEISFQGGGVLGGSLGEPDIGACTTGVTNGCDATQNLHHDNAPSFGVYPGMIGGLKDYQRFGGQTPGNGGVWGFRFGWNLSPKWQLEFVYNHAHTGTAFTNQALGDQQFNLFQVGGGFPGSGVRTLYYVNGFNGHPQGDQNMYLFNLNRHFNAGGRFVPYIGGGIGAVSWYAGPKFNTMAVTNEPAAAQFFKGAGSSTGFAFDLQAGTKYYLTPSFGLRADVADVVSFPSLRNQARTFDLSGLFGVSNGIVPISGGVKQDGKFNQLLFTGGVFWAFGGGWQNDHANVGSFSSDNFWDHWEFSWNYGGVHGSRFSRSRVTCTPAVANGCDLNKDLGHDDGTGGVAPGRAQGSIANAFATGGLKPGDGWATGLRLAYNFTPNWDVSFIWNFAGTGTSLDNQAAFNQAEASFYTGDDNSFPRSYTYVNGADGHPRGNQAMYLFNVDRNFHVSRRFVPYVGAGLGMESWLGAPRVDARVDMTGSNFPNVADFGKSTKNESGFAFDIAAGGKYYMSRHWGVRFDVMNVWSYNSFKSDFVSVDTSGLYGTPGAIVPVAGTLKFDGNYSQLLTSAGMFFSFGQGGTWTAKDPLQPGSGAHAGRWELSFQTGGVIGGNLGRLDLGSCKSTAAAADGCNVNQPLNRPSSSSSFLQGVYPGKLGPLRNFQRDGGVQPGNGGLYGIRLGYNVTPRWQIEFVWNHLHTNTAFTNQDVVSDSVDAFNIPRFSGSLIGQRLANYLGNADATPQGDQNQWLVNLNRNFNVSGRVVPYVGFGIGAENWFGGPSLNLWENNPEVPHTAQFTKFTKGATGFAFNLQTGAKIYITNNFGLRADFSNVMSFQDLEHRFQSIDISGVRGLGPGALVPISGSTTQSGRFNQAQFTAGMFWSIGGRMDSKGYSEPSGDRESLNDHWELSFNFGGVKGSSWGNADAKCTEAVAGGCDVSQRLSHRTNPPISVFPGRLVGTLPSFMASGGVKPGDGWMTGFQVAYNFNPDWQLALIYNLMGTGTRFDNYSLLRLSQEGFFSQCDCQDPAVSARTFNFDSGADGTPRGTQSQILVNINRNFMTHHRLVPYIGAGLGAVIWNDNPNAIVTTVSRERTAPLLNNGAATFYKTIPSTTGFALDLAAGLKYYVGRHWGLRAEMMNVVSFQDFNARFATIDVTGQLGTPGAVLPVAGKLSQSTRFNQTSGSGGVFWTF